MRALSAGLLSRRLPTLKNLLSSNESKGVPSPLNTETAQLNGAHALEASMAQVYNFLDSIDAGYIEENPYHNAL